jgi:hypothetical protein
MKAAPIRTAMQAPTPPTTSPRKEGNMRSLLLTLRSRRPPAAGAVAATALVTAIAGLLLAAPAGVRLAGCDWRSAPAEDRLQGLCGGVERSSLSCSPCGSR